MDANAAIPRLSVMADMAGCPNRCRHCWLGGGRDGAMGVDDFRAVAAAFRGWRDEPGGGVGELGFFSWWREPDYRDDYRALWELEKELSSPGRAQRFELLSTWRLARDDGYAAWAASIGTKVCQISFFGMEESTDWGMRRRGAFRDQLRATERCIEAGISPRWQLFVTKRCLGELDDFLRLMERLDLAKRCEVIGGRFEMFIGGISPEGSGFAIERLRLEQGDLALLPDGLVALSRDGAKNLGRPERELIGEMARRDGPANLGTPVPALAVDAGFDVYPNVAEPAPWWRLGNLRADGVDAVMRTFREGATPGMTANRTIPVAELAAAYGCPDSDRLYDGDDLISRFLHQWGVEHAG